MHNYTIPILPFTHDVETKAVLKKLALAHKALAELNGVSESMPNEVIILNTLSLQEAKDSSAIENIITTHDELYSSDSIAQQFASAAAKINSVWGVSTTTNHPKPYSIPESELSVAAEEG